MEWSIILVEHTWPKSDDDGDDGRRRDLFIGRTWWVFVIMQWKARDCRDGRRDVIPFIMEWIQNN